MTQRGNGRAQTFFSDDDYLAYRELMAEQAAATGVEGVVLGQRPDLQGRPERAEAKLNALSP